MRPRLAVALALCAVQALGSAAASGPLPPWGDRRATELSLQFARTRTVFAYDGVDAPTEVSTASIFARQRLGETAHLGLLGGASFLTQTDNPVTAGAGPRGNHLGISLELELLTRETYSVFASAGYVVQRVQETLGAQTTELSWDEWRARAGAALGRGALRGFGGATLGTLRGTERLSGTLNQTRGFSVARRIGAFGGLDYLVDADGYIGIEARSGLDRGALIYFRRRY